MHTLVGRAFLSLSIAVCILSHKKFKNRLSTYVLLGRQGSQYIYIFQNSAQARKTQNPHFPKLPHR